jgi:hypothetical protein
VPAIGDDRDTARAVLSATVDAWGPRVSGAVNAEVWANGYQTMRRLGFIDGSVPVEEMYDTRIRLLDD